MNILGIWFNWNKIKETKYRKKNWKLYQNCEFSKIRDRISLFKNGKAKILD